MRRKVITEDVVMIFLLLTLSTAASAQCEELTQRFERPVQYNTPSQMMPDRCHGTNDYGTHAVLSIAPRAGYLERKLKIRATVITEWDADTCVSRTVSTKFDTIITSQVIRPQISDKTVGGYYTCRLELMVTPPTSAPLNCVAVRLPSNHQFADYWVTSYGEFTDIFAAKRALKAFKLQYPEYCSAFVYFIPTGCEYMMSYQTDLK